jgi:hypothetical protein
MSRRVRTSRRTTAVVLDDLIAGTFGTTTDNVRGTRGLFDGNSILAHVLKPDIVDVARPLAVDTLCLVSTDNNVPEKISTHKQ